MKKSMAACALALGLMGGLQGTAQAQSVDRNGTLTIVTDTMGWFTFDPATSKSNELIVTLNTAAIGPWSQLLPNLRSDRTRFVEDAFVEAVAAGLEPAASVLGHPVAVWRSMVIDGWQYYLMRYRNVEDALQAQAALAGGPLFGHVSNNAVARFPLDPQPFVPKPADMAPAPGMWALERELTGKPGRGLQIDTQGDKLVILSYFGYRADGSATFLQSSGRRDGNRFEGDLVEYRGGTALGETHRDGEATAVAGRIVITFDSPTSGLVELPGEAPQRIQRFQYENLTERFNNTFFLQSYGDGAESGERERVTVTARDGKFVMASAECRHEGIFRPADKGIRVAVHYCANRNTNVMLTAQLVVDEHGFFSGDFFSPGGPLHVAYRGACIGAARNDGSHARCQFLD